MLFYLTRLKLNMTTIITTQPRELNSWRAAGLLYGDLGTSKAYVLGLAFAMAGHASFWFILAVSVLTLIVGINYVLICKFYPSGGGVYTSLKDRSKVLSVIGAFFLISDYFVTAALSALSAFNYLGVAQPELWAMGSILLIGLLNFLGPKRTGNLAIALAVPMIAAVFCLALLSLPFIPLAVEHLQPAGGNLRQDWNVFVGIIVALSGIEAIANTTSSMKLDPGFSYKRPSVYRTSTPAILFVIFEVCFFTSLLGLAMNALPGLEIVEGGHVSAPDNPNVRDSMLRYMGEIFAGELFGATVGKIVGGAVSIVVTLLLLSAVNTAIVALCSLFFVMSRDDEMPQIFQKLNRFGVPSVSLWIAFLIPIALLAFVNDVSGLANLYAIGFVGAIAVNLGATSTNLGLDMTLFQRIFMFGTSLIMGLIELTLFVDKPDARGFVVGIIGVGLLLRALAQEQKKPEIPTRASIESPLIPIPSATNKSWMVAITGLSKSLEYALEESQIHQIPLYILFIREQKVVTESDHQKNWLDDPEACKVFDYIIAREPRMPMEFVYTITAHTAHSVSEIAQEKKVSHIILGRARKASLSFLHVVRGTTVRDLARLIPERTDIIVVY